MGRFNRNNSFGGNNNRDDRQMHETTCSDCGRRCEVPFKPSNSKPVYCNGCFKRDSNPRDDYSRDNNSRGGGNRDDRQMHEATCADCGRYCEVPFRPSHDKPVYCNGCFGKGNNSSPRKSDHSNHSNQSNKSNKEHSAIGKKLDKIISLLEQIITHKEVKEEIPKKAAKKAKKATPKKAVAKKATPKKESKKAVTKKAEKKVTAKKVTAKKTVKKVATKKAAPKKAVKKTPTKK